jgi:hypothetical protein
MFGMETGAIEEMRVETKKIALKILGYLGRNPSAMDTVQGISEWWIRENPKRVEEALSFLVGRNIMSVSILQDRSFYWLDKKLECGSFRIELEEMSTAGGDSVMESNGDAS